MLVLPGDTPLITTEVLRLLGDGHAATGADATVLTMCLEDPTGYGRVVRCADLEALARDTAGTVLGSGTGDNVARIVEHKDATDEERSINEVNSGMYLLPGMAIVGYLDQTGAGQRSR